MKSTQLYEDGDLRTYLLVMDQGDEAFSEISRFARENDVNAASLTAIGACTSATLAYFDPDKGDYVNRRFIEQMEIASLIGDIAEDDGKPALHAHVVLGRRDYSAIAGHLQEIHVFPTMEVVLTETPAHLRKRLDKATGLTLISPRHSTEG
ncbi:MAG TPA: PPC domain-containing DNA-binding protein [Thermomicrobiales bacterium]|jgi:predicted DNA-binding protein with PD1-like motif|nr:PPC domain-containing DNA-binding protein [Thermomicrobiales bacterium]